MAKEVVLKLRLIDAFTGRATKVKVATRELVSEFKLARKEFAKAGAAVFELLPKRLQEDLKGLKRDLESTGKKFQRTIGKPLQERLKRNFALTRTFLRREENRTTRVLAGIKKQTERLESATARVAKAQARLSTASALSGIKTRGPGGRSLGRGEARRQGLEARRLLQELDAQAQEQGLKLIGISRLRRIANRPLRGRGTKQLRQALDFITTNTFQQLRNTIQNEAVASIDAAREQQLAARGRLANLARAQRTLRSPRAQQFLNFTTAQTTASLATFNRLRRAFVATSRAAGLLTAGVARLGRSFASATVRAVAFTFATARAIGTPIFRGLSALSNVLEIIKAKFRSLILPLTLVGTTGAFVFLGLARAVIQTTQQFETYRLQLRAVTRDTLKAEAEFAGIRQFAAQSPLTTDEVVSSFVRLRAVGVPAARETVKELSNIAVVFNRDLKDVTSAFIGVETEVLRRLGFLLVRVGSKAIVQAGDTVKIVSNDIESIRESLRELIRENLPDAESIIRNSLLGQFKVFTSLVQEISADLGESFRPAVTRMLRDLNQFLSDIRPFLRNFSSLVANNFGKITDIVRGAFDDAAKNFSKTKALIAAEFSDLGDQLIKIFSETLFGFVELTVAASSVIFEPLGAALATTIIVGIEKAFREVGALTLTRDTGVKELIQGDFATVKDLFSNVFGEGSEPLRFFRDELALTLREVSELNAELKELGGIDLFSGKGRAPGKGPGTGKQFDLNKEFTLSELASQLPRVFVTGEAARLPANAAEVAQTVKQLQEEILIQASELPFISSKGSRLLQKATVEGSLARVEETLKALLPSIKDRIGAVAESSGSVADAIADSLSIAAGGAFSKARSEFSKALEEEFLSGAINQLELAEEVIRNKTNTAAQLASAFSRFESVIELNAFARQESERLQFQVLDGQSVDLDAAFKRVDELETLRKRTQAVIEAVPTETRKSRIETNRRLLQGIPDADLFGSGAGQGAAFDRVLRSNKEVQEIVKDFLVTAESGGKFVEFIGKDNPVREVVDFIQSRGLENEEALRTLVRALFKESTDTVKFSSKTLNDLDRRTNGQLSALVNAGVQSIVLQRDRLIDSFDKLSKEGGIKGLQDEVENSNTILRQLNSAELRENLLDFRGPKAVDQLRQRRPDLDFQDDFLEFLDRGDASKNNPKEFQLRIRELGAEFELFLDSLDKSDKRVKELQRSILETIPDAFQQDFENFSEKFRTSFLISNPERIKADFKRSLSVFQQGLFDVGQRAERSSAKQGPIAFLAVIAQSSAEANAEVQQLINSLRNVPEDKAKVKVNNFVSDARGLDADARKKRRDALANQNLTAGDVVSLFKTDFFGALEDKIGKATDAFLAFGETVGELVGDIALKFSAELGDAVADFVLGVKSAKAAFSDLANGIVRDLIRIAVQRAALAAISGGVAIVQRLSFADGGIASHSINPNTKRRAFATGGIAKGPTQALFGEKKPEAFVPLPDGRTIPVTLDAPQQGGSGDTYVFNVSAVDASSFQRLVSNNDTLFANTVAQATRRQPGTRARFRRGT